jgi:hypothetical protein
MPIAMRAAVISIVLVGFLLSPCSGAATSGSEDGWVLEQQQAVWGRMRLSVTKNAVRFQHQEYWAIVATAPRWDAVCVNFQRKLIYTMPYASWRKNGFAMFDSDTAYSEPVMPKNVISRDQTLHGLPTKIRQWRGETPKLEVMSEARIEARNCVYTLVVTPAIHPCEQARQLITAFYRVPSPDGMPLSYINSVQRNTPMLKTYEVRQAQIADSDFQPPSGLKPVKTDAEFWIDKKDKRMIEDAAEMLREPGKD